MWIGQREGLVDGFGVPDQEHLHGSSVSHRGASHTPPVRDTAAAPQPIEWVDTAGEAGQVALRELSPIRKVPIVIVGGKTLFDSHVIVDWLITTRGYGGIAP